MRKNLARPAGLDEPEVCSCGHYAFVHGLLTCGGWAHPDHTRWGRVRLGRWRWSFHCPCMKGWVNGELIETPDYL